MERINELQILVLKKDYISKGTILINNQEALLKQIRELKIKLQEQSNKESLVSTQLKNMINLLSALKENTTASSLENLWNLTIKLITKADEFENYEQFNILNEMFRQQILKFEEIEVITNQKFKETPKSENRININYTNAINNYDIIFGKKREQKPIATPTIVEPVKDLNTTQDSKPKDFSGVIKSNINLTVQTYDEDQTHVLVGNIIVRDKEIVEEMAKKYLRKENAEQQFLGHILNLLLGNELPKNSLTLDKVWKDALKEMYNNEYYSSLEILHEIFEHKRLEFIEFSKYEIPKYPTTKLTENNVLPKKFELFNKEQQTELALNQFIVFGNKPRQIKTNKLI